MSRPVDDASARPWAEPIAVVGIGCALPGARGPAALWRLLLDGRDAVGPLPPGRFDLEAWYDARPGQPGKLACREGGFLEGVDQFDADFFGLSPREAAGMDPQQRLLLEVAYEALEDAGLPPERLAGSRTGVFVGMATNDYEDIQWYLRDPASIELHANTGGYRNVAAGRLSWAWDLRGPSFTVDTACSSSLVALQVACQSLAAGECHVALAAGANLVLLPQPSLGFARARVLSPDCRCKFADASANGFVRSDGVVVVVLKPLARALADGDPIYAQVLGGAVDNDGRSGDSLSTPGRAGQELVLRLAYAQAGVAPADVQYVEAHGTGTSVGDPIELAALGAVLGPGRAPAQPCLVGSIKTNIGHTEGTAGLAGFIKVALALQQRRLPPSLHVRQLNPRIPWDELPLQVVQQARAWPAPEAPLLAGVSAFGIGGTNAHVVLAEAPERAPRATSAENTDARLFTLSAHTPQALGDLATRYAAWLEQSPADAPWADVCYTRNARRGQHDERLALVASSAPEAADVLRGFLAGEPRPHLSVGKQPADPPKLVFVFPGQGSQWLGMGRAWQRERPFRATLEACEEAFRPHVDWSLLEQLDATPERSRLDAIDVVQPMLFALAVALAALWRSWGLAPDAVIGHSMGEIAAAHVAGALTLEDAARVICRRSRLLRRKSGQGAMAVVELGFDASRQALAGHEHQVAIAVSNSRSSTVLSGEPAALQAILRDLERQDVFCKAVNVDVASHSPQMDDLTAELLEQLAGLCPGSARVPLHSTVLGRRDDTLAFTPDYWVRNLRQPVLFGAAIEGLLSEGHTLFVELSAHPLLLGAIQQGFHHTGRAGLALPSLRRQEDERAVLLGSLGALHTQGLALDWSAVHSGGGRCVALPGYAWQREHHWRDDAPMSARTSAVGAHALLGEGLHVASGTRVWDFELGLAKLPYLADHRVQGVALLPAAAALECALAATGPGAGPCAVEEVRFLRGLFLADERPQAAQVVVRAEAAGGARFQLLSRDGQAPGAAAPVWTLHVEARASALPACERPHVDLGAWEARAPDTDAATHYRHLAQHGLDYGAAFQGVEGLWHDAAGTRARVRLPAALEHGARGYRVHPALLDGCLQVLAAALLRHTGDERTRVPTRIASAVSYAQPGAAVWAHASGLRAQGDGCQGDVDIYDEAGDCLLALRGVGLEPFEPETTRALDIETCLYAYQWRALPAAQPRLPAPRGSWLVLVDRAGLGAAVAAQLALQGAASVCVDAGAEYAALTPQHYRIAPERPQDYGRLVAAVAATGVRLEGVLHLWSLDAPVAAELSPSTLHSAQVLGCESLLHLVQALLAHPGTPAPHLRLVTRGVQAVGAARADGLAQAPLWGLGRTLAQEHPEFDVRLVDLDVNATADEADQLCAELHAEGQEDQLAWHDGRRHGRRLVRLASLPAATPAPVALRADEACRLESARPGLLDSLVLRHVPRRPPGPDQVELRVEAAGLNFSDVLIAMGLYPGQAPSLPLMGLECAGTVLAVGTNVHGWKPGDAVIGLGRDVLGTHATLEAEFVFRRPAGLSAAQAAGLAIPFLTAAYALEVVGRLERGERVLIHSATGGVGLAAVQLAQRAGAEVYATAGSPERRAWLRARGLEHVFDSRSLAFVDDVRAATGGEGVDVVLNSLSGAAIAAGLGLLRPNGRFLELGKTDVYRDSPLGLAPFRNNLTLAVIDLERLLFRERRALLADLLRRLLERVAAGALELLPYEQFPLAAAAEAFHHIAQARHLGKVVLSAQPAPAQAAPAAPALRPQGTYLITGGLGGLGLVVAEWLAERGVRHLALMGRSAPDEAACAALSRLAQRGVQVTVLAADVAVAAQVAQAVAQLARDCPPLAGVMHAAGVLDDGIVQALDRQRLHGVLAPKVQGAWNLHQATAGLPLELFVLFSSVASMLGNAGQGNYSAANAFLDALAEHRRARGLPGLSIQWGAWSQVGLAARAGRRGRLAQRGLGSLTPPQGLQALERVLRCEPALVAATPVNWAAWSASSPAGSKAALLTELEVASAPAAPDHGARPDAGLTRTTLLAAQQPEREALVVTYLSQQLARVLRLPLARLDARRPLIRLGLDSLMAVELRNRLDADLGLSVPVARVIGAAGIAPLAAYVLDQVAAQGDPEDGRAAPRG